MDIPQVIEALADSSSSEDEATGNTVCTIYNPRNSKETIAEVEDSPDVKESSLLSPRTKVIAESRIRRKTYKGYTPQGN
jgi:hypothetical protein